MMDGLGVLLGNGDTDTFDWKGRAPQLLWQMSYNLDAIAGMIEIGTSAAYRLEHPDMYPPKKQES